MTCRAAILVVFGTLLSCAQPRTDAAELVIAPASDSAAAASSGSAPAAPAPSASASSTAQIAPTCGATLAFSAITGAEHAKLPAGVPATVCDAISTLFSDYDASSETSVAAGGALRAGGSFMVTLGGRTLVALPHYTGEIAKESFLCGCCEAKASLALLELSAGKLVVVAKTLKPIAHAGLGTGLTASPLKLRLDDTRELVLVESAHTCGTAPLRRILHGLEVDGQKLVPRLEWRVGARGSTGQADVSEVTATVTNEPGPGVAFDLVFAWSRALCPFDQQAGEYVCGPPKPTGSERLRWSGSVYKLHGPEAKLEHFNLP